MYKRLFILIEGNDDERFIDKIVNPIFMNNYDAVIPYKYAEKPRKKNVRLIKSILSMKAHFICLADINQSPCVTAKKQRIKEDKIGEVSDDRIIIVKREIESWYLAGLDDVCCKKLSIPTYNSTEKIDKEQFKALISKSKHHSRISCMVEILKNFNVMVAKKKNESFNYFHRKYLE